MDYSTVVNCLKNQRKWSRLNPVPSSILPMEWRHWVLDRGSLTQRLIQASHGDFKVKVLDEYWSRPSISEALHLEIDPRHRVYIREVALICSNIPRVIARSVIPEATMTGYERQLKFLNEKPLGAFLFQHPHMHRGEIHFAGLNLGAQYQGCPSGQIKKGDKQNCWARRSLFYLSKKSLLVNEVFLPEILSAHFPGTP